MATAAPTRLAVFLLLSLVLPLLAVGGVNAQEDQWSFVITPQIWATHVARDGFAAPAAIPNLGAFPFRVSAFAAENSGPVDILDPQWGLQLAAQKGRWTLAGSFQYVNFETRTDVVLSRDLPPVPFCLLDNCLRPGDRAAEEFINTTRLDMDFSVSYFFPDVVPRWLDFSLGGGVKVIYASASRTFGNVGPLATAAVAASSGRGSGLYLTCSKDDCSDFHFQDRVKTKTWLYGATVPMSAIFHLTNDARWLLPLNITPFIGAETRNDQDVVYKLDVVDQNILAKRLDGTTFASGVTVDATVRYLLNEMLSVYTGMRVQYIKAHEKYLAYGPLFGMSVRFGGK